MTATGARFSWYLYDISGIRKKMSLKLYSQVATLSPLQNWFLVYVTSNRIWLQAFISLLILYSVYIGFMEVWTYYAYEMMLNTVYFMCDLHTGSVKIAILSSIK